MKRFVRVLTLFIFTLFLAACGPDADTQSFLDKTGGIWYDEIGDAFLVIEDDMTITTFSAILLADSSEFENHSFSTTQKGKHTLNKEKSGAGEWEFVLESESDGTITTHYLSPSPIGTTMEIAFNTPEHGWGYSYLGEVEEFERVAASIYKEDNRPYSAIDQLVYLKLLEKSGELGIVTTAHLAGDSFFLGIDGETEGIGTAVARIKAFDASIEDKELWKETKAYWGALMKEASDNDSDYDLKVYYYGKDDTDILLEIDLMEGTIMDYLGSGFGQKRDL